jgi:hypothetical protein
MPPANLPLRNVSIKQFCVLAQRLLDAGDQHNFVRLVVSGIFEGQQYVVNPLHNRMGQDEPFRLMHDFDSAVGIAKNIMVDDSLTMFPVARREDTLSASIHLDHQFENSRVSQHSCLAAAIF